MARFRMAWFLWLMHDEYHVVGIPACQRASQMTFSCQYHPEATISHHGATLNQVDAEHLEMMEIKVNT